MKPRNRAAFALVALVATAVALLVPVASHAQQSGAGGTSPAWYHDWQGYTYKGRFGSAQGHLFIRYTREDTNGQSGSSSSRDWCYWEGTFHSYDHRGSLLGSWNCYGYARKGGYCYFKLDSVNWFCMGRLSHDLRSLGGDVCDFNRGGFATWFANSPFKLRTQGQ
jgi:hypothetical protein